MLLDPFFDISQSIFDNIFALYKKTYGKLGMREKNAYGFTKYNRWILIRGNSNNLVAFVVFKTTQWGLKLVAVCQDGSREGKDAAITFVTKALNIKGVYGEVSPPLESVLAGKVPEITVEQAREIIPHKLDQIAEDPNHYTREITGIGKITKLVVGKPIMK